MNIELNKEYFILSGHSLVMDKIIFYSMQANLNKDSTITRSFFDFTKNKILTINGAGVFSMDIFYTKDEAIDFYIQKLTKQKTKTKKEIIKT